MSSGSCKHMQTHANHHLTLTNNTIYYAYHTHIAYIIETVNLYTERLYVPTIGPLTEVTIGFTNAAIATIVTIL